MQRVNEHVIFHIPQVDITNEIIDALPSRAPQVGSVPEENR
jgi:hypothetical protein